MSEDKLKILGLEDASPNLRQFVERKASEVVKEKPYYKKDSLEVLFYKEGARLSPRYEDGLLNFFTVYGNDLDDSIDEDFPHVLVYLRVFESVEEQRKLWIGRYNAIEDGFVEGDKDCEKECRV